MVRLSPEGVKCRTPHEIHRRSGANPLTDFQSDATNGPGFIEVDAAPHAHTPAEPDLGSENLMRLTRFISALVAALIPALAGAQRRFRRRPIAPDGSPRRPL